MNWITEAMGRFEIDQTVPPATEGLKAGRSKTFASAFQEFRGTRSSAAAPQVSAMRISPTAILRAAPLPGPKHVGANAFTSTATVL